MLPRITCCLHVGLEVPLQKQWLWQLGKELLEHRSVVMWFIQPREQDFLEVPVPQAPHKLLHPLFAARLPEDSLIAGKALNVSQDLEEDIVAVSSERRPEHKSMVARRFWIRR